MRVTGVSMDVGPFYLQFLLGSRMIAAGRKNNATIGRGGGGGAKHGEGRADVEEMPVKDDGQPLPYQDHQRCNNGSGRLQKKSRPIKWLTASTMLSALPLSLSLASILRAAGIYYQLYPFRMRARLSI